MAGCADPQHAPPPPARNTARQRAARSLSCSGRRGPGRNHRASHDVVAPANSSSHTPRQLGHACTPLPRPHRRATDGLWQVLAPPPLKKAGFFVLAVRLSCAETKSAKKGEKSIEGGNLDGRCVRRRTAPPEGANPPPRARVMPLSLVVSASPNFHGDASACLLCVLFSLRAPLLRVPAFVSSAWHFHAGRAGRPGLPSLALFASGPPAVCRCRWCHS